MRRGAVAMPRLNSTRRLRKEQGRSSQAQGLRPLGTAAPGVATPGLGASQPHLQPKALLELVEEFRRQLVAAQIEQLQIRPVRFQQRLDALAADAVAAQRQ